ncbi:autoinducer binding domain-containing protein [Ciceribacter sp. L1K23]|uniref:helix-turn-helix transcriptional regulator n=1 Tax=Ciceribacter sp. L1K23 TaxID=2820276 RepID=UPI001B81B55C|nr:autoinducer binding domain-containing protein [Ciceribacter sp. L1K23]MBR0554511.1 autoinducer binding domain-containing protein [Ciceribacter sp. L1K23]
MFDEISVLADRLSSRETLDDRIDEAFSAMRQLGFEALIYDYTPTPCDIAGQVEIPTLLKLRNVAGDMYDYWCNREYFRIDPVQRLAMQTSVPFFWNYDPDVETKISRFLTDDTKPVCDFLREHDMLAGITVPVHMPRGDYATVTGVRYGARRDFSRDAMRVIADFSLLAHVFHEAAYELFDDKVLNASGVRLTERERECLTYSSYGLSAKEISRIIDRSVPTVVMHLNSATRKLGAKNRTQAVVRATQCRLLSSVPAYKL